MPSHSGAVECIPTLHAQPAPNKSPVRMPRQGWQNRNPENMESSAYVQSTGRGCVNDGNRTIIIIMSVKNLCPVDFSPQIRSMDVIPHDKKSDMRVLLCQRHPVGSGVLRRLTGFPTGHWFVKLGRGSVIIKRVKTNHEYTFLCSEPQIFTCVSKTKVGSIFFDFWMFVLAPESFCNSLIMNELAPIFSRKHHHFFIPTNKCPEFKTLLIIFLNCCQFKGYGRLYFCSLSPKKRRKISSQIESPNPLREPFSVWGTGRPLCVF